MNKKSLCSPPHPFKWYHQQSGPVIFEIGDETNQAAQRRLTDLASLNLPIVPSGIKCDTSRSGSQSPGADVSMKSSRTDGHGRHFPLQKKKGKKLGRRIVFSLPVRWSCRDEKKYCEAEVMEKKPSCGDDPRRGIGRRRLKVEQFFPLFFRFVWTSDSVPLLSPLLRTLWSWSGRHLTTPRGSFTSFVRHLFPLF